MHGRPLIGLIAVATLAVGGAACRDRRSDRRHPPPAGAGAVTDAGAAAAGGPALRARLECQRCHDGTGLAAAPIDKHCVACHQQILRRGDPDAPAADVARWQQHIVSLVAVPPLAGVGGRLRRAWVRDLLLRPVDVRPAMPATMPRLPITAAEADAIAAELVPAEAPPATFDPTAVAAGAALYRRLGCATCHTFTGAAAVGAPAMVARPAEPILLAPDLAITRARFQPGALIPFLRDPRALAPDGVMPGFGLSEVDAGALAAFVMLTPLAAPAPVAPVVRLPPLTRVVRFAEVEDRVFRRICWHCHSSPAYALGDGGAGNTGGFGYRGRGLDLSTSTGVLSGGTDDDGRRRSVLAPLADGTPRLIAHLVARHREVAGELVPGITGMPLGLPPLSLEDIQLVESWIAQGRPL